MVQTPSEAPPPPLVCHRQAARDPRPHRTSLTKVEGANPAETENSCGLRLCSSRRRHPITRSAKTTTLDHSMAERRPDVDKASSRRHFGSRNAPQNPGAATGGDQGQDRVESAGDPEAALSAGGYTTVCCYSTAAITEMTPTGTTTAPVSRIAPEDSSLLSIRSTTTSSTTSPSLPHSSCSSRKQHSMTRRCLEPQTIPSSTLRSYRRHPAWVTATAVALAIACICATFISPANAEGIKKRGKLPSLSALNQCDQPP